MTTTKLPMRPVAREPASGSDADVKTPEQLLGEAHARFRELYIPRGPTRMERVVEIAVALILLVACAPLMLCVACLIRCGSKGPALFRQTRIREGLTGFTFYKFRTMIVDGDQRYPSLVQFSRSPEELSEFRFKVENDPRITRIGAWLRRTSLDELPNLWNLLTGEVALVGPRPEIPAMLANYDDQMLEKFSVRPGITGLAQVCGRGNLTFLETIQCDLDYVEKRSVWLDIKILFLTLFKCLTGCGAK